MGVTQGTRAVLARVGGGSALNSVAGRGALIMDMTNRRIIFGAIYDTAGASGRISGSAITESFSCREVENDAVAKRVEETLAGLDNTEKQEFAKATYQGHIYLFHFTEDAVYVCVGEEECGMEKFKKYMGQIKSQWHAFIQTFDGGHDDGMSAPFLPGRGYGEFNEEIKRTLNEFSKHDRFQKVKEECEESIDQLFDNIELSLSRHEEITSIEKKTEDLAARGESFRRESRAVKNRLWCKNASCWIILAVIICGVLAAAVLVACHPNFKACTG